MTKEYLIGRFNVQCFSGAVIQPCHERLDLFSRHQLTICAFRKIQPYQSVGVFIEPTLPRTIRIGKEKVRLKSLGYLLVAGKLFVTACQKVSEDQLMSGCHFSELRALFSAVNGHIVRLFWPIPSLPLIAGKLSADG